MKGKINNLLDHVQSANRLAGVEYTLIASIVTGLVIAIFILLGNRVFDSINYLAGKF